MEKDLIERIDFLLKFDKFDKGYSVGRVICLEDHFREISEMLDEQGIPKTTSKGKALTVIQRVTILSMAFEIAADNCPQFGAQSLINSAFADFEEELLPGMEAAEGEEIASGEELGMLIDDRIAIMEGT